MSEFDGNPEFVPGWDVYRDPGGKPVLITVRQSAAIWHAISVVEAVRQAEGYESLWVRSANLAKSRLLGRMLFEGLPPTKTKPPLEVAGPAWWLLGGGDPFRRVCRHCGESIRPSGQGKGWVHADGDVTCERAPEAEPR